MPNTPHHQLRATVDNELLRLTGGDPFHHIIEAADRHRPDHMPKCGLFPAGPQVMRLASMWARAHDAKRILDIGTGFGYSALWLGHGTGDEVSIDAVDRFAEHILVGRDFAKQAGMSEKINFIEGTATDVLETLPGPYDFIHDDGWFAYEPPYFERVVALLRKGGILSMPNWFLLEDAITNAPARDWSEFAGPRWAEGTSAYAKKLAADPRLMTTWITSPPLGISIKL